jgi:hypothetical protein
MQGDVSAIRVRHHVCGREVQRLEQRGEIIAVLIDAARASGRSLREWPRRS